MIGQMVSQYRILRTLSAAGMTVVCRVKDTKLGQFVGLKSFLEEFCMNGEYPEYSKPAAMDRLSDRSRLHKVQNIFHEAIERPPSGWRNLLEEACAGDISLRKEVEALLRAHNTAGSFLSSSSPESDEDEAEPISSMAMTG